MTRTDRVDAAFDAAAAETGIHNSNPRLRCAAAAETRSRRWTTAEDAFLRANLGKLSEKEIARRLRRTPVAVHIRRERDLHLQSPSKSKDVMSAECIGIGVGKDGKSIHALIDRGILPGHRLPGYGIIRLVNRMVLMKWLLNPENWVYVDPARIGELRPRGKRGIPEHYDFAFWAEAAKVVQAARRRWKDAWLTPGQVAELLHVSSRHYINTAIHKGNLPALRWGNWWIRRSAIPRGMTINYSGEWVKA